MKYSQTTAAFIVVLLLVLCCYGQSNPRDVAIRHYIDGRNPEAVQSLKELIKQAKYSNDAELIEYLGLAYLKTSENKDALKDVREGSEVGAFKRHVPAQIWHTVFCWKGR